MAGTRRNNWGTKVRGYTCRRSWAGAKSAGCGRFVRAEPLEAAIWTRVGGWINDPELLVSEVTGDSNDMEEQLQDEIRQVEQGLRNAEQGKRNILSVLERHLAEPDECLDALRRIRQRIEELSARHRELEVSVAQPRADDVDRIRAWAGEWLDGGALDELPFERRRLLVRQLVVNVAVHEAMLVVRARIPGDPARSRNEDVVLDAPGRVGRQPGALVLVERLDALDEADRSDGNQVLGVLPAAVKLLHDVGDQPQVVFDQLIAGLAVAGPHPRERLALVVGRERLWKGGFGAQVPVQQPDAA